MQELIKPVLSAYSPQKDGDDMEGGYASSRKGLDGKFIVRTLEDFRLKKSSYVTLAGHPSLYFTKYMIPIIEYKNADGDTFVLKNVRAYLHDTGSAFRTTEAKTMKRFDLAVDRDMSAKALASQPWSMKAVEAYKVDRYDTFNAATPATSNTNLIISKDDLKAIIAKHLQSLGHAIEEFTMSFGDNNSVVIEKTKQPVAKKQLPEKPIGLPWIVTAKSLIGVEEDTGSGSNDDILSWAEVVGVDDDYNNDSIPWCGLFTGYCFSFNRIKPPATPLWALSWNTWGIKLSEPAYGCVMVFKRDGGGHVGFYVGEDDDYYFILGGNQSDAVNIKRLEKERCVGYRWPAGYEDSLVKGRVRSTLQATISKNES